MLSKPQIKNNYVQPYVPENTIDNPLLVTLEENHVLPFTTRTSNITNRTCRLSFNSVAEKVISELDISVDNNIRKSLNGEVYITSEATDYPFEHGYEHSYKSKRQDIDVKAYGSGTNQIIETNDSSTLVSEKNLKENLNRQADTIDKKDGSLKDREIVSKPKTVNEGFESLNDALVMKGLKIFKKKVSGPDTVIMDDKENPKEKLTHQVDYSLKSEQLSPKTHISCYQKVYIDDESNASEPRLTLNSGRHIRDIVKDKKLDIKEEDECHPDISAMRIYCDESGTSQNDSNSSKQRGDYGNRYGGQRVANQIGSLDINSDGIAEDEHESSDDHNSNDDSLFDKTNNDVLEDNKHTYDIFQRKLLASDQIVNESHKSDGKPRNVFMDFQHKMKVMTNAEPSSPFLHLNANPNSLINMSKYFVTNHQNHQNRISEFNLDQLDCRSNDCYKPNEQAKDFDPRKNKSLPTDLCIDSNTDEENVKDEYEPRHLPTIRESENESNDVLVSRMVKENPLRSTIFNPLMQEYTPNNDDSPDEYGYGYKLDNEDYYNDENARAYEEYIKRPHKYKTSHINPYDNNMNKNPPNIQQSVFVSNNVNIDDDAIMAELMKKSDEYDYGCPNFVIQPHLVCEETQNYASHVMLAQVKKINEFNRKRKFLEVIEENQKSVADLIQNLVEDDLEVAKVSSLIKAVGERVKKMKKNRILGCEDRVIGHPKDIYEFVDLKTEGSRG